MHKIIKFLAQAAENNNYEWFNANHKQYALMKSAFAVDVRAVMKGMEAFEPKVAGLPVSQCIVRFHRDLRIRQNREAPFKEGFTAIISPFGPATDHAAYGIHMEPGNSYIFGGTLLIKDGKPREAVRRYITTHTDEFAHIVHNRKFKKLYPNLGTSEMERFPRGYDKKAPYAPFLYARDFTVRTYIDDQEFSVAGWHYLLIGYFRTMAPFVHFVEKALEAGM